MKTWINPEVEALDLACTEYGHKYAADYDEVRVDQNGQLWFSFSSGSDFKGSTDGDIEI